MPILKRLLKSLKRIWWGKKRRKTGRRKVRSKLFHTRYSPKKGNSLRSRIVKKTKKVVRKKKPARKKEKSKKIIKPQHYRSRPRIAKPRKILRTKLKGALPNRAGRHLAPASPGKIKQPINGILIGEITHYFSKIGVVVVKLSGTITVGDEIIMRGKGKQFRQKVRSLQIESVDVRSAGKGHLVGLKSDKKAHAGDQVYRLS